MTDEAFVAASQRLEIEIFLREMSSPDIFTPLWRGLSGKEDGVSLIFELLVEDLGLHKMSDYQMSYFNFSEEQRVMIMNLSSDIRDMVRDIGYTKDNSRYVNSRWWSGIEKACRSAFISLQSSNRLGDAV